MAVKTPRRARRPGRTATSHRRRTRRHLRRQRRRRCRQALRAGGGTGTKFTFDSRSTPASARSAAFWGHAPPVLTQGSQHRRQVPRSIASFVGPAFALTGSSTPVRRDSGTARLPGVLPVHTSPATTIDAEEPAPRSLLHHGTSCLLDGGAAWYGSTRLPAAATPAATRPSTRAGMTHSRPARRPTSSTCNAAAYRLGRGGRVAPDA
jgi:hypothetical protein